MSKESMEVMARLTGSLIEIKEFVDKFILITYDLPVSEAGNKARAQFLADAKLIGAVRHTDSCYLMPWTKSAETLAMRLARAGEVCVWTSQTTDEIKAKEITKNYDNGLQPQLDEISDRIDRISDHVIHNRMKRAYNMLDKTEAMLDGMEKAIIRRGSAHLYVLLALIKERYRAVARNLAV